MNSLREFLREGLNKIDADAIIGALLLVVIFGGLVVISTVIGGEIV